MSKVKGIRLRYILAFWLFILSGVAFLDRTNISIAGLNISREYGLGNQRLGWIFSSFLIGYAVFQLPGGWMSARFGPRRVLTAGLLLWAVTTALTAMLPTTIEHAVLLLIGVRFVLGAGESVIYPAANQFVARWVPLQERGVINGLIFAGVGAGQRVDPADADLADQPSWLAIRVLVQCDCGFYCRNRVVADCPGYAGGTSGGADRRSCRRSKKG